MEQEIRTRIHILRAAINNRLPLVQVLEAILRHVVDKLLVHHRFQLGQIGPVRLDEPSLQAAALLRLPDLIDVVQSLNVFSLLQVEQ